jgi:hypothetical protein
MIRHHSDHIRRGAHLIELVLILPVLCMVLVQVTMVIRNVLHLSNMAKHRSHASLQISKLERALRQDAHEAVQARWVEETASQSAGFRMEGVEGRYVEYQIKKRGLVRIAVTEQGKRKAENFDLFDAMETVVDIDQSSSPSIAVSLYRVVPGPNASAEDRGRLELLVESAIGRHRRLAVKSHSNNVIGAEQARPNND